MPFDDKLSRFCLKKYPDWPPKHKVEYQADHIEFHPDEDEVKWLTYTPQEWLEYKINIPNDGRERVNTHPEVEYKLTKEELEFAKESSINILCNPILCPNYFEKVTSFLDSKDEAEFRFQWLWLQMDWIQFGFPRLPSNALLENDFLMFIFEPMIYKPFIEYWGIPPDDFWIKFSDYSEGENLGTLYRGFIIYFYSQGRIFPPPHLYHAEEDPNPTSLYLPDRFWENLEN